MIHICYALTDKNGQYYLNTAISMCSVMKNTKEKILFHIVSDNTLVDNHKENIISLANKYGHKVMFYNIMSSKAWLYLCKLDTMLTEQHRKQWTLAMFYRLFIYCLLPIQVNRCIYFDSDIIVNMDVVELWNQKCNNGIGAVLDLAIATNTDKYQLTNNVYDVRELGLVTADKYFNSGVMIIERKAFLKNSYDIYFKLNKLYHVCNLFYPDQDFLNVLYSNTYTELRYRFNTIVGLERLLSNVKMVEKSIYHYANGQMKLNYGDCFNNLAQEYIDEIYNMFGYNVSKI